VGLATEVLGTESRRFTLLFAPAAVGAVVHLLATTHVEKSAPAQAANLVVPGYRLGV